MEGLCLRSIHSNRKFIFASAHSPAVGRGPGLGAAPRPAPRRPGRPGPAGAPAADEDRCGDNGGVNDAGRNGASGSQTTNRVPTGLSVTFHDSFTGFRKFLRHLKVSAVNFY